MSLCATVKAEVTYRCYINDDDEAKIRELMNRDVAENNYSSLTLEDAVWELYSQGELDLYDSSREVDFSTEEIEKIEEE